MKKAEALLDASAFFCFECGKPKFSLGLPHSINCILQNWTISIVLLVMINKAKLFIF